MLKYFTDNNKLREYYSRFYNFIDENSKEVKPKYDFWVKQVSFVCPCCLKNYDADFGTKYFDYRKDKPKSEALWYIQRCFTCHLFAVIRLSGDIEHIELLIKIVGKDLAKVILIQMAKKNMLVALRLKKIVDKLNK